jgi:endonuclease YncB( thermonuclease family)
VAALPWSAARAAQLSGTVVRVVDGDRIVLEVPAGWHRVRLAGIDAPEQNQPWGRASTRELRRLAAGKQAVVEWYRRDRYRQLVGVLQLAGRDINRNLVEQGLAWYDEQLAGDLAPCARRAYARAETEARAAKRGLWSDGQAVPPWQWRGGPR